MHEDKLSLLGVSLQLVLLILDTYEMHYVFLNQGIYVYLCLALPLLYACIMHNIHSVYLFITILRRIYGPTCH